ncbi:HET-domain-containing protein [Lojkania enalia]|uniref:HET-domain-containing protein n=1 Tax=Lojkania enalia TaxID=147567 RepID=A0A9P4JYA8_9PLEO|nr:HET-domain-containing protein [Didymosphaeria enalia]
MVQCEICCDLSMHHQLISIDDLTRGLESGCEACAVLSKCLRVLHPRQKEIQSLQLEFEANGERPLVIIVEGGGGKIWKFWRRSIDVYTLPGIRSKWEAIGPARHLEPNASSPICFSLIQTWLQECRASHPNCNTNPNLPLPTRVINVGSSTLDPYLHITSPTERGSYAALSHCWGKVLHLTTTFETLKEKQRAIPFSMLPKTFQNAVTICRELNIPYLWIDALCIIQDSPSDWALEASRMASVYQNAYITIVATDATDSSQGFFVPMKGKRQGFNTIMSVDLNDNPVNIYVRHTTCDFGRFHHFDDYSAIGSRAWVLQEQLLSPRLLRYSARDISFICTAQSVCECKVQIRTGRNASDKVRQLLDARNNNSTWNEWMEIVRVFSARKLTYDSDRLPAIAGLATNLQPKFQSEYLVGLWKDDLVKGLLWTSVEGGYYARRHKSYYAPTWSWASLVGHINYKIIDFVVEPVVDIIDTGIKLATANPYGSASSGYLTVTGPVADIVVRKNRRPHTEIEGSSWETMFAVSWQTNGEKEVVSEVEYDVGGEIAPGEELLLLLVARCVLDDKDVDKDEDGDEDKDEDKDEYEDGDGDNGALEEYPAGLLLRSTAHTFKGYVRVGILNPSTWAPSGEKEGSWSNWLAVTRRETLTVY